MLCFLAMVKESPIIFGEFPAETKQKQKICPNIGEIRLLVQFQTSCARAE